MVPSCCFRCAASLAVLQLRVQESSTQATKPFLLRQNSDYPVSVARLITKSWENNGRFQHKHAGENDCERHAGHTCFQSLLFALLTCTCARQGYIEASEFGFAVCARELLSELKCADAGISCRLIRSSLCLVHVHRERAAKPTVREHWTSDRRATISAACLLPSAFCKQRAGTASHSHPRFLYKWCVVVSFRGITSVIR